MNRFIIDRSGILSTLEKIVENSQDMRLFRKLFFKRFRNSPVRFHYHTDKSLNIQLQVLVRFGTDAVKVMQKLSEDLKKQLSHTTGMTVQNIEIRIMGIFHE